MRRLLCWVLDGLILLVGLIGITAGVLWVRDHASSSEFLGENEWVENGGQTYRRKWVILRSSGGRLAMCLGDQRRGRVEGDPYPFFYSFQNRREWKRYKDVVETFDPGEGGPGWLRAAGLGYAHRKGLPYGQTNRLLEIPNWLVMLVAIGLVGLRGRRIVHNRRLARRARTGLCLVCGYDLRASEERCPECGTAFTRPAKT